MTTGHGGVDRYPAGSPQHEAHTQFLHRLLDQPQFSAAVQAYRRIDENHDVPFLGGSNNAGDTIYFDRHFAQAVKAGRVKYDGQPYDPRPFVMVHEAVEGAAIRLLGLHYDKPKDGMPGAHEVATWAERRALQHAGYDWAKHQAALDPWIKAGEHERVTNPPPDLLVEPYKGTPEDKKVEPSAQGGYAANQTHKLSHAEVRYGPGKPRGDHCAVCRYYIADGEGEAPACRLVRSPILPDGWCNRFAPRE